MTEPSGPPPATTPLGALSALGTSVWLDSIRRSMIETGELERLVREDSVVGVTANPAIFEKAILGSPDYDERLAELAREGVDVETIYETLAVEDVQGAADVLRGVYERSGGLDGYVSLEVAPALAHDTEGTLESARDFWERLGRPNVMIKIPGTEEGVEAIRRSIAAGINVNVTLLFSVEAYAKVAEAYLAGLEERVERGEPLDGIASVASFFVSRVDTMADSMLAERGREDLTGQAAVANARLAYDRFRELFDGERFAALRERGARVQRPLWASTATKNPHYSDLKYVEGLAGPDVVNTMPMATLLAVQDHGDAHDRLTGTGEEARRTLAAIESAGVSLDEVTGKLLDEGIASFGDAMEKLLAGIDRRRAAVVAGKPRGIDARLGDADAAAVGERVAWATEGDLARRVWRKDHTLWGPESKEITDRLGWLVISEQMLDHLDELQGFANEVRDAGFTHCALLGMGGSSLAPEVMRRTHGARDGYLALQVLDSTHPDAVAGLAERLPLERTLFLVSTKSGTTLETRSFYEYFRDRVGDASQFVAVTDPGTPLAELAEREGFRRIFLSAPDIGGRYSALSYFGLVPAALIGVDLEALLERAEVAVHCAMPSLACEKSPALWLGLALGELARRGRDKLAFVVSDPLRGFGLWVEQLVAESTGKEGRGIVPVVDEPLGEPAAYGDDRAFAYVRNEEDPDEGTDRRIAALAGAGHPVLAVPFAERADLGAQLFLWEFAIAVAGAVLGINAFDQPNVQEAKDLTVETIERDLRERPPEERPDVEDGPLAVFGTDASGLDSALGDWLDDAGPGDYVAIMAYLPPSDRADAALTELRGAIRDARRIATTVGYGPRFLHSTGQLHKGGPPRGRFLQLTGDAREGEEIPGAGYGFDALIRAQAIGDLRALRRRELAVLRVHIAGDPAQGLRKLASAAVEAVAAAD